MKFAAVILFVLIQDAFSASTEAKSFPWLRKFTGLKAQMADGSADYENRGLFSFYKPTKRPTSANVVFITVPSDSGEESEPSSPPSNPSSSEEEPSWPAWPPWPYWPGHPDDQSSTTSTTSTTTPKPSTHPHLPTGDYPHYLPFLPPLILPIPGWTGNPPPPYIPPSYHTQPDSHWPDSHWPDISPETPFNSAPGTITFATEIEKDVTEDEDEDEDENEDEPVWVPLGQNSNAPSQENSIISSFLDTGVEPKPSKKPRPFRKTTTTTSSPFSEQELSNKRTPTPTRKPRPIRKTTTASPIVETQNQVDNRKKPRPRPKPKPSKKPIAVIETVDASNAVEVSSEKPESTSSSLPPPLVVSSESPIRRGPSRKPRPSRRPTTTAAPLVNVEPSSEVISKPLPPAEDSPDLDDVLQDGSGDSEVVQPQPKPMLINADEEDDSLQITVPQMTDETVDALPETNNEDLTSAELLGPDKDLIVVQRKGKPMKNRRREPDRVPPWQLFKLPRDTIWEKGPEQRAAKVKYVFYG